MIRKPSSNAMRQKRHLRIRKHISGTAERPRLSIYRSNKQFYVQLIDDVNGHTLAFAHSSDVGEHANIETAKGVAKLLAEKALKKGIKTIVFDRSGYLYHGRIKALAEALREAGLQF